MFDHRALVDNTIAQASIESERPAIFLEDLDAALSASACRASLSTCAMSAVPTP